MYDVTQVCQILDGYMPTDVKERACFRSDVHLEMTNILIVFYVHRVHKKGTAV